MKQLLAALLMSVLSTSAAIAQEVGGKYSVNGTNFDGSPYTGEATVEVVSNTTCKIAWKTGGTSSSGFCMRNDDAFAAGYVMGNAIGLIIYKMQPDGSLKGLWTITGRNGVGTETLTPIH